MKNSMGLAYSRLLPCLFGWWPLGFGRRRYQDKDTDTRRIAYIMWHFPLLSETFIQREITALQNQGLKISILADGIPDTERLDESARKLINHTTTVLPMIQRELAGSIRYFAGKAPLRTVNVLLYLLFHRYHERKTFQFDMHVFKKTVCIADSCRRLGITHVHSPWSDLNAITGLLAARLLDIPFSLQARAHDIHRKSYLHGLKKKFQYAELVITNTNYNAGYIKSIMGRRDASKVRRIYNGIPLQMFPYRTPGEINGRPIRILTVARLIEQKGIDNLLRCCAGLREMGIGFHATIVGGPEEGCEDCAERLILSCHELELDRHVEFVGERSLHEIIDYYRFSDIFALPSKIASDGSRDIIPNVLMEAMAIGVPCVSTRVTGIPEIIDDGTDGLLVAPGDVRGLIEATVGLARDARLRKKLSVNARRKVELRFDIQKNAEEYRTAFNSLDRRVT